MGSDLRKYMGLPLTIDDVVARYLRVIADGPECVAELRRLGFTSWCGAFRRSHQQQANDGVRCEWDSRDYTDEEMREIYDGIILHASRREAPAR